MSRLPGFTVPGGPVNRQELLEAWRGVYLVLFMVQSNDPTMGTKLQHLKDLLAEVHGLVEEVLAEDVPGIING